MAKAETTEDIIVEVNGTCHRGQRKIIGTETLDQIVAYQGCCVQDFQGYPAAEKDGKMLRAARQIVFELALGRRFSTESSARYGL